VRVEKSVRIVNTEGLHARPSGAVVSLAAVYESELRIGCGDREVDGRSILGLITLGATCGSELCFKADGPDAEALVDDLVRLVEAGFPLDQAAK